MTTLVVAALAAVVLIPGTSRGRLRAGRGWSLPAMRRRRAGVPHRALIEVVAALRDELRAGAALHLAFERAAGDCPDPALEHAVAVCRMGGDVAAALRQEAARRGLLVSLAALWRVAEGSGAALADALDRLVAGAEQSEKVRREVAAQLAGPRSTVRVLAALPLIGVGMGVLMGADPLGFLLGSPWGWGCLLVAGLLEAAGLLWMRHLVRGIETHL